MLLPTLGRPTMATKPEWKDAFLLHNVSSFLLPEEIEYPRAVAMGDGSAEAKASYSIACAC